MTDFLLVFCFRPLRSGMFFYSEIGKLLTGSSSVFVPYVRGCFFILAEAHAIWLEEAEVFVPFARGCFFMCMLIIHHYLPVRITFSSPSLGDVFLFKVREWFARVVLSFSSPSLGDVFLCVSFCLSSTKIFAFSSPSLGDVFLF